MPKQAPKAPTDPGRIFLEETLQQTAATVLFCSRQCPDAKGDLMLVRAAGALLSVLSTTANDSDIHEDLASLRKEYLQLQKSMAANLPATDQQS